MFNYILPNNKPINDGMIAMAMLSGNSSAYFLDIETGKVAELQESKVIQIEIPIISDKKIRAWMKDFVEGLVVFDDVDLAKKLIDILSQKEWKLLFIKEVKKDENDWIHGWHQWQSDSVFEVMEEWFSTLSVDIQINPEIFDDDCELCRMMRDGVNEMEKVLPVFQRANAKQMVDETIKKHLKKSKN